MVLGGPNNGTVQRAGAKGGDVKTYPTAISVACIGSVLHQEALHQLKSII